MPEVADVACYTLGEIGEDFGYTWERDKMPKFTATYGNETVYGIFKLLNLRTSKLQAKPAPPYTLTQEYEILAPWAVLDPHCRLRALANWLILAQHLHWSLQGTGIQIALKSPTFIGFSRYTFNADAAWLSWFPDFFSPLAAILCGPFWASFPCSAYFLYFPYLISPSPSARFISLYGELFIQSLYFVIMAIACCCLTSNHSLYFWCLTWFFRHSSIYITRLISLK